MHGLLFGEGNLEHAVAWLVEDALRDGTPEAFTQAAERIIGIQRFLICLGPDLNTSVMGLNTTIVRMELMAHDEGLRTSILAELGLGSTPTNQSNHKETPHR
jgi:hypothetical protein